MTVESENEPQAGKLNLPLLRHLLAEALDESSGESQKLAVVEAKVEALIAWIDNELRPVFQIVTDESMEALQRLEDRVKKLENQ